MSVPSSSAQNASYVCVRGQVALTGQNSISGVYQKLAWGKGLHRSWHEAPHPNPLPEGRGAVKLAPLRRRSRGERGHVKLCPLRRRSRGERGAVKHSLRSPSAHAVAGGGGWVGGWWVVGVCGGGGGGGGGVWALGGGGCSHDNTEALCGL